jgi:TRAP-type C4-dicarboxylate transport system substrate-binding protein
VRIVTLALLTLLASTVRAAEPTVLRMAAVAPEGTAWAREMHAFARDVEQTTAGRVRVKWFLSGIAGDDLEELGRIRRGQLDGAAGAVFCEKLAPSLQVVRTIGLFRDRAEVRHVLDQLRPKIDAEFAQAGFAEVGLGSFGIVALFTNKPVRTLGELRQLRLMVLEHDRVVRRMTEAMHLKIVPLPLTEGRPAIDAGQLDGFLSVPSGMLAFQWSTRVKYFLDLRISDLTGCMIIASRVFDRLPPATRDDVRGAAARFTARFAEVSMVTDDKLLGGLFEKQGMTKLAVSDAFRTAFFSAARAAEEAVVPDLVPKALLDDVRGWLTAFRANQPPR